MSLAIESDPKKRRLSFNEEGEIDEDAKMERFFALIRSAKDIRDRLLDNDPGSRPPPQPQPQPQSQTQPQPPPQQQPRHRRRSEKNKEPIPPPRAAPPVSAPPAPVVEKVGINTTAIRQASSAEIQPEKLGLKTDLNCRNHVEEEEKDRIEEADRKRKSGRIMLDLNLNLSL